MGTVIPNHPDFPLYSRDSTSTISVGSLRREQHLRVSIGFVRATQCRWVQKGESDEHHQQSE